ncbi:opacity protein-like surface antigen [Pseudomonas sp. TE3786]
MPCQHPVRHLVCAALLSLLASAAVAAETTQTLTGCAAKRDEIQQQIEQAKAAGNSAEQAGLETALSQVKSNCTDEQLEKSREQKVLDAQHEVKKRENELQKAMSKGDPEKIDSRKNKLAEARKELDEAKKQLER